MSVQDATVVDAVAQAPDGRIALVMVEERRYGDGDGEAMGEDLRHKLAGYAGLIRSGSLEPFLDEGPAGRGVDVELLCQDTPSERALQVLLAARGTLAAEGIGLHWRTVDRTEPATPAERLGVLLLALAPDDAVEVRLHASLVGDGLAGGLAAVDADGSPVPLDPDPALVELLQDLKHDAHRPGRGTWLTVRALARPGRTGEAEFDTGEPPDGAGLFPDQEWAEEARRYPRDQLPPWWPPVA